MKLITKEIEEPNMKVLGIKIQESTIKKLKDYCKKNGLKMGAFVEIIILEYLRTNKN